MAVDCALDHLLVQVSMILTFSGLGTVLVGLRTERDLIAVLGFLLIAASIVFIGFLTLGYDTDAVRKCLGVPWSGP